jgi:energy-coupling factor transporter ATP-binding protein EcfA2
MKTNTSRNLQFTPLIVVFLAVLASIVNNALTDTKEFKTWLQVHRIGIEEIVVGIIVIAILTWIILNHQNKYPQLAELRAENVEPDVKKFFDSLKERYQNRFQSKLDGRFEMTLEVAGNFDSPHTHLITERYNVEAGEAKTTEIILEAFENRDRLLIVGSAGSGKTTLLLRLAVSLLDKVELAGDEALPVIFNLASWSNGYERLEDWLQVSLESGYGLSKDFAATLLRQERITPLLDGLDELAKDDDKQREAETRGGFLRSLNQYLIRGKKVVVSCRHDEFLPIQKFTGHDAPFAATVALLDLTKTQIEKALLEARRRIDDKGRKVDETSAGHILEFLKRDKDDVLLDTLRTPFYFTTALEVFNKPIHDDEQLPDNTNGLKKYLLDEFVAAKLYRTPNPHNFRPEKTRKWLKFLGTELELSQSVDFELSSLQPHSLSHGWVYELLHGSFTASGIYLCFGPVYSLIYGVYVIYKLFDGSRLGSDNYSRIHTEDIRRVHVANLRSPRRLKRGLFYGLMFGVLAFLIFNLRGGLVEGAVAASVLGLFIGVREVVGEVSYFVNVKTPYQRLEAGFKEKILILAVVCLLMNFLSLSAPYHGLTWTEIRLLLFSFFGGALIGLSSTPLFRHVILRLRLYGEGKAPLKYATFLDYAANARILEKDGGRWRFRHQHLQTYLADMKGKKFLRVIEEP